MPYTFHQGDQFLHIEWYGVLADEDLKSFGARLREVATGLGHTPHILHSFAGLTDTQIKPWSLFEHSLHQKRVKFKNVVKCAWVADRPEIQRMGQLVQELNRNPNLTIELFDSMDAATAWLSAPVAPRPPARRRKRAHDAELA